MKKLLTAISITVLGIALYAVVPNRPPASVSLAWDHSPDFTNGVVTGYYIYWGTQSRVYANRTEAGPTNFANIPDLVRGTLYFFTATAHDANGLESDWCNEVAYKPSKFPEPPVNLR